MKGSHWNATTAVRIAISHPQPLDQQTFAWKADISNRNALGAGMILTQNRADTQVKSIIAGSKSANLTVLAAEDAAALLKGDNGAMMASVALRAMYELTEKAS
jgi:hypothetical protein